jgi:hypothetical protein
MEVVVKRIIARTSRQFADFSLVRADIGTLNPLLHALQISSAERRYFRKFQQGFEHRNELFSRYCFNPSPI